MSLWKIREQRKRLGTRKGKAPKTRVLVLLLVLVLVLIWVLDAVAT